MDWRREYASYLKGYAQARLGPYPDCLRYDIEIAFKDDDAAMFTIMGKIHDASSPTIEIDGTYHYPQIELAPIVFTRQDVEDNRCPRILDEKLPAWVTAYVASRPGRPTLMSIAIDAIYKARKQPPHVR